jgi:two-component system sensor histidine kinase and response regulator WspE
MAEKIGRLPGRPVAALYAEQKSVLTMGNLDNFSMADLFRVETDSQSKILTAGLLALEDNNTAADQLEILMRAAHSLKGAARIVNLDAAVRVSHAMEDCFVAAQKSKVVLHQEQIDLLLKGVDLLIKISKSPEVSAEGNNGQKDEVDAFVGALTGFLQNAPGTSVSAKAPEKSPPATEQKSSSSPEPAPQEVDRVLRVTAEHLNRLLGLAGESLVESRRFHPFTDSLLRLKRQHGELARMLGALREALSKKNTAEQAHLRLQEAQNKVAECGEFLASYLAELEMFDRRSTNLSHRLYSEALACRMRPFSDGIQAFPRMVRDVGRSLAKEVKLEISGESTSVDRDMLEKLEAPLTHLLRNAVDHGIEPLHDRLQAGKPSGGIIRLEARHSGGMLQVTVSDDGSGIDPETLRQVVIRKKLAVPDIAAKLSEAELLEFLFLPGFTLRETVTEISGRGIGLDVVQNMVKQVRGTVRVFSQRGQGTRFQLQLPLSLSVVRTLLAEIAGEPYAVPLAYITRTLKLPKAKIETLEGRQHFNFDGQSVGLVMAHQVLGTRLPSSAGDELPVIVVEGHGHLYGIVVDRFLDERELVVHPLDRRLGKIKDISAGALMEDGSPGLIIDVEDLIHSINRMISSESLSKISKEEEGKTAEKKKQILIVDDSLTVRELERKLLLGQGYHVEVAKDGMEGWNAVRTGHFDLVISDVDMPRMDGIELVTLIKQDARTRSVPVMIVSYKDREEDRRRGLEAGADYYLTKGSFHDESLLNAIVDLIGKPGA